MTIDVIKNNNLYKEYHLGSVGRGTLYRDLQSLWAKIRNKPDPNSLIDSQNFNLTNCCSSKDLTSSLYSSSKGAL